MKYLKVAWAHDSMDDPVLLYSEIGGDDYETRKVEVFRDGSMTYADEGTATGRTWLGEAPLPSIEEISADPEFRPKLITQAEFEQIWEEAHRGSS